MPQSAPDPLDALARQYAPGTAPADISLTIRAGEPSPSSADLDAIAEKYGEIPTSKLLATGTHVDQPDAPSGFGAFVSHYWRQVNPIGLGQLVPFPQALGGAGMLAPVKAAGNLLTAQKHVKAQGDQAWSRGDHVEAVRHYLDWLIPVLGPVLDEAANEYQKGQFAAGSGDVLGLATSVLGPKAVQVTRESAAAGRLAPAAERVATAAESGAASRVQRVMSPEIGPNKVRFGTQAAKVAPQIAQDLVSDGAPWSRVGLQAHVADKLAQAEAGLDAATDARLVSQQVQTGPLLKALDARISELTAPALDASRPTPGGSGDWMMNPNGFTKDVHARPLGAAVEPTPSGEELTALRQARREIARLGPVASYESVRRIRQAWDQVAKVKYNPSLTADFLKKQGEARGAIKATGAMRDALAAVDPATAKANADYALYRGAHDVLEATAEVERTRPHVGRIILARLTTTMAGVHLAGLPGAVAGFILAPVLEGMASSGVTTKLQTAKLLTQLAGALRKGQTGYAGSLAGVLKRLAKPALAKAGQLAGTTSPSLTPATAGQP